MHPPKIQLTTLDSSGAGPGMYVANQPSNHPLLCCMCSAYHSCSQLCNLPEPESKKMIIAGVLQGIWTPMTSFSETALMKKQSISEFSQENNKQIRSLMFFDVFCCLARFQKRYMIIMIHYDTSLDHCDTMVESKGP